MRYRPDVEGLRAVAVGLVVAAHADVPGFSSGFIGVDVFFVISEYLVTGLLLQTWKVSGHIDLATFYARRFRRLLPALLAMLLGTGLLCWWVLPPYAQMLEAVAGASAALWLANFHFVSAGVNYFGADAEPSVFLHTWSLGVEEQFYLVWPLLLTLVLWGTLPQRRWTRRVLLSLALIAGLGLVATVLVTYLNARLSFYMMPSRAWQFAVGGMSYLLGNGNGLLDGARTSFRAWAIRLGAGLLLVSVWILDKNRPYPSFWALLPTLGTALLLWGGEHACTEGQGVKRVLRHRAMLAVGRVSYGWYLWHWPLLTLAPLVLPFHGALGKTAAVAISLGLAVLSYLWIERPLRRRNFMLRWPRAMNVVAMTLMCIAATSMFLWGEHAAKRSATVESPYRTKFPGLYAQGCDDWYHSDTLQPCIYGNPHAKQTAYLLGDSIGVQWFPAMQRIFADPEWRLVVLTKSSCPMAESSFYYPRLGRTFDECDVWRRRALKQVVHDRPDVVILGSSHNAPLQQEGWIDGTRNLLRQVAPAAKHVFVLQSTPVLPFNGAICAGGKSQSMRRFDEARHCVASITDERREKVAAWILQAASAYPNVQVLDMGDAVCPQGLCRSVMGGRLVYRDQQHLDGAFVDTLTERLQADLAPALAPKREQ
ncbi:acyltransferase family protein [Xenophilus azovorans]|uniref:acyltransferase family protein n=1 Tax=Xenophilus azovorans TaxID=151755 RepID=UPI000A066542|nr:acyltransferase family protein [Xenophilus azovorans]